MLYKIFMKLKLKLYILLFQKIAVDLSSYSTRHKFCDMKNTLLIKIATVMFLFAMNV